MAAEARDITIIGGGPTGLFAAFYIFSKHEKGHKP